MSRCFPFPPPGYEKKPRTDDVELLKREKHREKKHKKEKKDKEKREKREKEGRDGKHKEKKDNKEKHREKKKDKDKDKDKDRDKEKSKISTADEKGFPGRAHGPSAVKLHQKEIKQNDKKDVLFEDKLIKQHAGNNGEKVRENNDLVKDNDGGAGNHLVQKFTIAENRKDEGAARLVAKGSGPLPDVKEKLQDKGINARKIDGRGIWPEARPVGNATVQNHARNFHPRVDEMPRPLEKNFQRTLEATVEGKEKVKKKKDSKQGDKRKTKEKEKKGHGKDKDRDKEKKKEEKAKEHAEHKNREQNNKLNESNKAGLVGSNSFTQVSKHNHENSANGENLKKRKDIESNGVLHANDSWPTKMPRPSSHPFTENGRILEPCQISLLNASDRQGAATNVKLDNKMHKINGILEALPSVISSNKTPTASATVPANPVTEASAKPPHPDAKYLSQVYSIPKTEVWSDFDDQEWLFDSGCSQERKPVVKSSEAGDRLQVWAETVHIEPADIFALPYVIPY